MKNKIILVHGYNKTSRDMKVLKKNLEAQGYEGILVDLPLTFKELDNSIPLLEAVLQEVSSDCKANEKITLVGHSTGGLVIRRLLATTQYLNKINKCILIATPNNGSELADLVGKVPVMCTNIFKTLKSLQKEEVKSLLLKENCSVEIGAIAGNKNNLILGNLLSCENDGRVTVKSVEFDGLKDFIILPYGHKEIHYQQVTVRLIDTFIKTSKFGEIE
ncbi:MAG: hypothetical protein JJT76_00125 [Clostridiaceae bacterium]|nr:hypothetical protein [Clostridiaceae bacterium]